MLVENLSIRQDWAEMLNYSSVPIDAAQVFTPYIHA